MTAKEPLLVKGPKGWGWGPWMGSRITGVCCLVARALGCHVDYPLIYATQTKLGRRFTSEEAYAVKAVDRNRGTNGQRTIIIRLAKIMGVEP